MTRYPRRRFVTGLASTPLLLRQALGAQPAKKAQIAITYDLEMSRNYPTRKNIEWDYRKGDLDEATKKYSLEAGRIAAKAGVKLHFFLVGRVLEQQDIAWLEEIHELGHPIGNHTYDHVYLLARTPTETQFRFTRSPWLVKGKTVPQILRENIRLTQIAMKQRAGIEQNGFRTPGGFNTGLTERPDIQAMLLELGFKWVSSVYPNHLAKRTEQGVSEEVFDSIVKAQADAQPFKYESGLIEVPMSPISDVNAFRSNLWTLDEFVKATSLSIKEVIQNQMTFDFLCHPSCLVIEDPQHVTLKTMIDLVKSNADKAAITPIDRIAETVK